ASAKISQPVDQLVLALAHTGVGASAFGVVQIVTRWWRLTASARVRRRASARVLAWLATLRWVSKACRPGAPKVSKVPKMARVTRSSIQVKPREGRGMRQDMRWILEKDGGFVGALPIRSGSALRQNPPYSPVE